MVDGCGHFEVHKQLSPHQSGRSLSTPLSGQGTGYQGNLIIVIPIKKLKLEILDRDNSSWCWTTALTRRTGCTAGQGWGRGGWTPEPGNTAEGDP